MLTPEQAKDRAVDLVTRARRAGAGSPRRRRPGRHLAGRAGHLRGFFAGLVYQPDSGFYCEPAVVSLDHAIAYALGLADGSGWCAAAVGFADSAGIRPAGAIRNPL